MKEKNKSLLNESVDTQGDKSKLTWETPELLELDFQRTEGGSGAFAEGTVGGLPVGAS